VLTLERPVGNIRAGLGRAWKPDTSLGRFLALLVPGIPEANLLPDQVVATTSGGVLSYANGLGRLAYSNSSDKRFVALPTAITANSTPFWMFLYSTRSVTDARVYFRLGPSTGYGLVSLITGGASDSATVNSNNSILITAVASTFPNGVFTAVIESTGARLNLYINGKYVNGTSTALASVGATRFGFGADGTNELSVIASHYMAGLVAGTMPANFFRDFHSNPYGTVFAARRIWVPVSAGGGGGGAAVSLLGGLTRSNLTSGRLVA